MIKGSMRIKNNSLKRVERYVTKEVGRRVKKIATEAYTQAQHLNFVYTGFMVGNWRVTMKEESFQLYGTYEYLPKVLTKPVRGSRGQTPFTRPEWEFGFIRYSGDSSEKIFFNEERFAFQNTYITNPTPYAIHYNQGGFRAEHANLVGEIARAIKR